MRELPNSDQRRALEYIQRQSMLEAVRQAVREEIQPVVEQAGLTRHCSCQGKPETLGMGASMKLVVVTQWVRTARGKSHLSKAQPAGQ